MYFIAALLLAIGGFLIGAGAIISMGLKDIMVGSIMSVIGLISLIVGAVIQNLLEAS